MFDMLMPQEDFAFLMQKGDVKALIEQQANAYRIGDAAAAAADDGGLSAAMMQLDALEAASPAELDEQLDDLSLAHRAWTSSAFHTITPV
jgi:hypothetical protein